VDDAPGAPESGEPEPEPEPEPVDGWAVDEPEQVTAVPNDRSSIGDAPLPAFRSTVDELKRVESEGRSHAYEVPSVTIPVPEYVGYWEDLEPPRRPWRFERRLILLLVLVGLFFVPLLIDGVWWLTLATSEVVVGTLLVLGSPPCRRTSGSGFYRRRVVLPTVFAACAALFGAFMGYDSVAFGTWSLAGPPPKILACGAEYAAEGGPIPTPSGVPLHRVGTTPSGLPMLGTAQCGSSGTKLAFVGTGGKVIPYQLCSATGC